MEKIINKIILSICDYSGAWSQPYRDAGYTTIQIDPKLKTSVDSKGNKTYGMSVQDFVNYGHNIGLKAHGVMLAPPCTHFTVSCNRLWKEKDADGRTDEGLEIVDACLWLKDYVQPKWWVFENPVGRLPTLRPDTLGKPHFYFQPHWYGDPYTKRTGLWGDFNVDLPRTDVEPIRSSKQGSWLQNLGGSSERTKELRSMTPPGFAQAFFKANP